MITTQTKLSSRERVNRALTRRDHDRIPRSDGCWPETIKRWQGEGLTGDHQTVMDMLGNDFQHVSWHWPVPFPGQREVLEEDAETQLIRDSMGKVQRVWKNRSGTPEHVSFDCDSQQKWEQRYKPALLKAGTTNKLEESLQHFRKAQIQSKWCCFSGIEPFEAMRQLVGDEVVLMAMVTEQDWVRDMSRTYTDLIIGQYEMLLAAGAKVDGVWVYGDIGYNPAPFFSPQTYRETILDDHKRMCNWAHAHGMMFIYHTDGNVKPFLPQFVEAGFDCLQPLEAKAGMDVRKLAPQYGDRLSFFGNIDMTVALTNDRDKLEYEVRTKLAAGMSKHGYLYHSDHSVPPQVSWDTYRFLMELLNRYGNYA